MRATGRNFILFLSALFAVRSGVAQATQPDSQRFRGLIDEVMDQFAGEIRQLGARLQIEYHEKSSGTGAFTLRKESGRVWEFHFYDGILKIKNVSEDVLSLIVCHELGHHLAGYPFKDESNWSAAEGQADYFSTHACAPRIWRDADGLNASFSTKISAALKGKCDDAYSSQQRRDLCYRTVFAVDTMRYYEGRNLKVVPSLDKPDPAMVSRTFTAHPAAQCRIDTQLAGAFCAREFDFSRVPGHLGVGLNTLAAERDAAPSHCDDSSLPFLMHRPRCWFASLESIHL